MQNTKRSSFGLCGVLSSLLLLVPASAVAGINGNDFLEHDDTLTSDNSELKKVKDSAFLDMINSIRQGCSIGKLEKDNSLSAAAIKHSEYLRYLDEQRPIDTILGAMPYYNHHQDFKSNSPHFQKPIKGLAEITGKSNPFFLAESPKQRVLASGYKGYNDGMEVIGYPESINSFSRRYRKPDESEFRRLLTGLLSVPYHASALLNPSYDETGVSYSLHRVNKNDPKQGIYDSRYAHTVVVEFGKRDSASKMKSNEVFTYPCNGTILESKVMQSEEPNPLKSKRLSRLLGNSPAGHPIHVVGSDPSKKISLSNIRLTKTSGTKYDIDTYIMSSSNDPHRVLHKNQSFIIPLRQLNSGEYRVVFDVKQGREMPRRKAIDFRVL